MAVFSIFLMLLSIHTAHAVDYIEYKIEINMDASAAWTITRVSDLNASIDLEGFPLRVTALVDAAANQTHREMSLDLDSLQVNDEISWETQSRTTIYSFTWHNFSVTKNRNITFGDAFAVPDFFGQLFGDGTLQISYPSTYSVRSVSPTPNEQDDSSRKLTWLRTKDFINGNPTVTLAKNANEENDEWQQFILIGVAVFVVVTVLLASVYFLRIRKKRARDSVNAQLAGALLTESEEEKVTKVLLSSGGTMRQSAIAEQCRFSKAKTSQLLAVLEQKKVITRYKKGRDKIVTLNERVTGEKQ